jgi:uncharacterized membrane protein YeaQ/YmgE (transglycosylase-associated protein family)
MENISFQLLWLFGVIGALVGMWLYRFFKKRN